MGGGLRACESLLDLLVVAGHEDTGPFGPLVRKHRPIHVADNHFRRTHESDARRSFWQETFGTERRQAIGAHAPADRQASEEGLGSVASDFTPLPVPDLVHGPREEVERRAVFRPWSFEGYALDLHGQVNAPVLWRRAEHARPEVPEHPLQDVDADV